MVEVTEIIRKLEQGYTEPYYCRCSDRKTYIVKGANATRKGLVKEWVCANIGIQFGLPIPEPVIVNVPTCFTEYGENPSLAIGECFGSTYVENLSEVIYSQLGLIDHQTMLDLYAFDYWIKNGDRCLTERGGNPNLFIDMRHSSVVVVDHNLAFDEHFSLEDHKQIHVASKFWNSEQSRMFDRAFYEDKFRKAFSKFDGFTAQIPDSWRQDLDCFLNQLKLTLSVYEHDEFWEGLK
ncbi:hypothetical protein L2728_06150 [Shewanella chilikensis]|uniref:HipA family kinase n=1 Tax=Shewanella chilikensis TaxID=558541 RepID=UPI00200D0584|nr:HipA family kinase [Shewanella chilikensis]MCL1161468.1 hypothetical protein [Shewanella chilikensis]